MKIDIITMQAVQNYGSVLQAYATQEKLKQFGCDVTIINFARDVVKYENLRKSWAQGNFIKGIIMLPTILRWKTVFKGFCENNLNLSQTEYSDDKDFESYSLTADAYCTGSDQVWNSKWNDGIIKPLYLSFVPKELYKFSFAASFGQDKLSKDEIEKTQEFIDEYNYISVRENSGLNILKNQYHKEECLQLIDPTLSFTKAFWENLSAPKKIKKDYILIYNLNKSKEFDKYAKRLSKETGLILVRLCTRYDQIYRIGKSVLIPDVSTFISLIRNAKYVLTDSFHATAFSMNMNVEPICIYPENFGGRIESFLQLTNSTQRHVKNYDDLDVLNRKVNFEIVNRILDKERDKIHDYLNMVINDILLTKNVHKGQINE